MKYCNCIRRYDLTHNSETKCQFLHHAGIVGIVTMLRAEQPGIQFFTGATEFSLLQNVEPPVQWVSGVILLAVKQLEHQVDHSF
jgi:hypothetical protein